MLHLAADAHPSNKKHAVKLRYSYMSTFANRSIEKNPINPIRAAFSSDRGSKRTATIRVLTYVVFGLFTRGHHCLGEHQLLRCAINLYLS